MTQEIYDGNLLTKDPDVTEVYLADWDREALAEGVELADAGTLAARPADGALVLGGPALAAGNRTVTFSIGGGRPGRRYRVTHRVTTNEMPARELERSFYILIQEQ